MITIAIVKDERCLERIVKKVWKSLHKKYKHGGELHASKEQDVTRNKMLQLIKECDDIKIMTIVLNKDKVYVDLQNQKHYLYTYAANVLLGHLHDEGIIESGEDIDLVIDRKDTKKSLEERFVKHLTAAMQKRRPEKFKVRLHASYQNKSLQAVDFISWAIFRKYEFATMPFYDLIESKIIAEKLLFK